MRKFAAALVLVLLASACGGGSDAGSSEAQREGVALNAPNTAESANTAVAGVLTDEGKVNFVCAQDDSLPSGVWVATGGPVGGLGYNVRYREDDPDTLFVTDAWAGMHVSHDGGDSWVPTNGTATSGIDFRSGPTLDDIPVFALRIDPHDNDVVWAGLRDGGGVYRSADGGLTWASRSSGLHLRLPDSVLEEREIDPEDEDAYYQLSVRGIEPSLHDPNVIYVTGDVEATDGDGFLFSRTQGFVFRSTDMGEQFKLLSMFNNLTRWIFVHPDDPDVLLVSTGIFDREPSTPYEGDIDTLGADGHRIGSGLGIGMFRSTDGGETWLPANVGISSERSLHFGGAATHPSQPGTVLIGSGNDTDLRLREMHGGLYLTEDFGLTWRDVTPPDPYNSNRGEEIIFGAVAFSPSDPNRAYAAGENTFMRSDDGGWTWIRVFGSDGRGKWGLPGIIPGNPIDMVVGRDDPDRVFINNYGGGNFVTEDAGVTWADASAGYTGANVQGISVGPEGCVIANGRSQVAVYEPSNRQWTGVAFEEAQWLGDGSFAAFVSDGERGIIAGDANSGMVVYSPDLGVSWKMARGLPEDRDEIFDDDFGMHAVGVSATSPNRVYGGYIRAKIKGVNPHEIEDIPTSPGMFKSDDGGATWEEINDGLPDNEGARNITSIAVSRQDPDVVAISTLLDGPFISTNGGVEWNSLLGELPEGQSWDECEPICVDSNGERIELDNEEEYGERILRRYTMSIAIDPSDDHHLLLGTNVNGVYESFDRGGVWSMILRESDVLSTSHRDHIHAIDIVFDPTDPSVFYVADWNSGVVRTTNGGVSFERLGDGLTTGVVQALAISPDGKFVYAATQGRGVFVYRAS